MLPPLPHPASSLSIAQLDALRAMLPDGALGAVVFFALWSVASLGIVVLFDRVLRVKAAKTANQLDDILAAALRLPLYVGLVIVGLWLLTAWWDVVPPAWLGGMRLGLALALALTVAHSLVAAAMAAMDQYARARPAFRGVQGVLEFAARLVFYSVALLLVLDQFGITITPILGAMGIAGLAVALALQDTLANFFAGLYVTLDRPLREGDYVELEGGSLGAIRGYVTEVGWRSIRIRELSNNVFIVPNAKVAQGIIKNYDLPEPLLSVLVNVSVAYGSDLERVERATVETAREVQKEVQGALSSHDPFIRFHTFGDNGIEFTVILRARTFVDQYLLKHEFVKALHKRFGKEHIEIPFPQRVLHVTPGNGGPAGPAPPVQLSGTAPGPSSGRR